MRKFVVPAVLTIIISALLIFVVYLPDVHMIPIREGSVEAHLVAGVFRWEMAVLGSIFTLVMVFFVYSIVAFRRKKEGEYGESFHSNTPLELAWTGIPLVFVVGVAFWATNVLDKATHYPSYDLEVQVHGQQWAWQFTYPDTGVVSDKLVLPQGTKIKFVMTSSDVIHSFWVPEFAFKQDAVPGRETILYITTLSKKGLYEVRCAELCGLDHAKMLAPVEVMDVQGFTDWQTSMMTLPDDPVERGKIFATRYGCVRCHSWDGTKGNGPTWQGIFGEDVALEGGDTAKVDEAYIKESILTPDAKIVLGFDSTLMPEDFGTKLKEDQINDLIAFIKSLGK
jgi:cytochrome c oxidase subunit 2